MYVPSHFQLKDEAEINRLIESQNFGLLVTHGEEGLQASHIPFRWDAQAQVLEGHLARPNPQCADLRQLASGGGDALAIFQGPHAYISPRYYASDVNVPTWNYLAVHCYGRVSLFEEEEEAFQQQERLVAFQEGGRDQPWSMEEMDQRRARGMLRGILAFSIQVTRIDAKAKLGQNKSTEDRLASSEALESQAGDALEKETAKLMKP